MHMGGGDSNAISHTLSFIVYIGIPITQDNICMLHACHACQSFLIEIYCPICVHIPPKQPESGHV